MGARFWKVKYTNLYGDSQFLEHIQDVRITLNTDAKSNKLEVDMGVIYGDYIQDGEPVFQTGEALTVYAADEPINDLNPDHLMGSYDIINFELSPEDRLIKLVAADKTYTLLSKVYIVKDIENTIPNVVNNAIQVVNEQGDVQNSITTEIASVRSDGSGFPSIKYSSNFKSAYDVIAELSQPEYTGDNLPYLFYFDHTNKFYWEYPTTSIVDTYNLADDDVVDMKMTRSDAEAVSYVIYNAGNDLNDASIWDIHIDELTSSARGAVKYVPMVDISKELKLTYASEIAATTIDNDDFIGLAKDRAIGRAQRYMKMSGRGLYKATITLKGVRLGLADLNTVSFPKAGVLSRNLRAKRVVHRMNKTGWQTQLELEEDPAALANI